MTKKNRNKMIKVLYSKKKKILKKMTKVTLFFEFPIFFNNQVKIIKFSNELLKIKTKIYKIILDMVVLDHLSLPKMIRDKQKIKF